MTLRDRRAHTTIYLRGDAPPVEVPQGDTLHIQEGWVGVTTRVQMDHPLSQPGTGMVEQTTMWPATAVLKIQTIRQVWN